VESFDCFDVIHNSSPKVVYVVVMIIELPYHCI